MNTLTETQTSEELHEIVKQPEPTCPIINETLSEIHDSQKRIRGYERASEEELKDIISDVERNLGSLSGYGNSGLLEDIRERTEEIRQWGEEWKRYALYLHEKIESSQPKEKI